MSTREILVGDVNWRSGCAEEIWVLTIADGLLDIAGVDAVFYIVVVGWRDGTVD